MNKEGIITISNPQKGIANSSILGNEAIIGCEIFEEPGVLKIGTSLIADSSNVNNPATVTLTGVPIADVTNYNSLGTIQRSVLTYGGQLLSSTNASSVQATNLSQGWDLAVWNTEFTVVSYAQSGVGYIGVIRHDPTSNTTQWNPAKIGSLDGTHYIKLLMGNDGYMYFTNGNNLGRITGISYDTGTGIVTVTSTSTFGSFVLPKNTYGVTLATIGSKLYIGTQKGDSYSVRNQYGYTGLVIRDYNINEANAESIMELNENGFNAMIANKNQIYFSAGDDGRIYVTDGTNYQLVKRLPFTNLGSTYNPTSWVYPNAMCINQKGNLLIGLSANYDANTPTTTGIWEIQLSQGYPTHLPFFSRDGNLGDTANVRFGSVRVLDNNALSFGVQSGTSYELSTTSSTALWSGYKAKWRTEAFLVGNARDKKAFEQLEFLLTKPLITNQAIKISYRKNLNDSFTEIDTFSYSTLGGVISHFAPAEIVDAEILQFEIALDYTSSVFGQNVYLLRTLIY